MTKLRPTDLAHSYLMNDLPSAYVPATRLYNILIRRLSNGRTLFPRRTANFY